MLGKCCITELNPRTSAQIFHIAFLIPLSPLVQLQLLVARAYWLEVGELCFKYIAL